MKRGRKYEEQGRNVKERKKCEEGEGDVERREEEM